MLGLIFAIALEEATPTATAVATETSSATPKPITMIVDALFAETVKLPSVETFESVRLAMT